MRDFLKWFFQSMFSKCLLSKQENLAIQNTVVSNRFITNKMFHDMYGTLIATLQILCFYILLVGLIAYRNII